MIRRCGLVAVTLTVFMTTLSAQTETNVAEARAAALAAAAALTPATTPSRPAPLETEWCGNGAELTAICYEVGHRSNRELPNPDGKGVSTFHMCPDEFAVTGTNMTGFYCRYVGPYTSITVALGKLEDDERRDFALACRPGTFMVGEAEFGRKLACASIGVPVTGEYPVEIGSNGVYGYCTQARESTQLGVVTSWHGPDRRVRCAVMELPMAVVRRSETRMGK